MKMRATGSPPKLAIYENGDDAPFSDPMSNLDRLKLHSDVPYLAVVSLATGSITPSDPGASSTVTLGSGPLASNGRRTNLFVHGMSYTPLIVGSVTTSAGTMPVSCPYGFIVLADETHVFIVNWSTFDLPGTIDYAIGVTNYGLASDGSFHVPAHFDGVRITPTRVQAGGFDTDMRYLQRDPSGPIPLVIGESSVSGLGVSTVAIYGDRYTMGVEEIYNVNGVYNHVASHRIPHVGYTPVDDSFVADVVKVSL